MLSPKKSYLISSLQHEAKQDPKVLASRFRNLMYGAPVDLEKFKRFAKEYKVKIVRIRPLESMNPDLHLKEFQVHVRLPDGQYGFFQPGGGPAKGLRSYAWVPSMPSNYTAAEKKKARIKEDTEFSYLIRRNKLSEARISDKEVAQAILDQMGGAHTLRAMLGARNFFYIKSGLQFQWPNKQRSKGNMVTVTLDQGRDTYRMEFLNASSRGAKTVKVYRDVYAEDLVKVFENQTGWVLRAPKVRGI